MDKKLFKILLFMKRHPDMSQDEFMRYYEEKHVPLALEYSRGMAAYKRTYITPRAHFRTGECSDLGFDVITELCFDDKNAFSNAIAFLSTGPMPDVVVEDEERLFDRTTFRVAICTEFLTEL